MSGTASSTLAYGLTEGGFVRMRLPEIRRTIFDDLNSATGRVWDESPDSLIGQIVNVVAEREAAVWELVEQVYLSAYPVSAFGQSLDMAVSYAGVRRLQGAPSRVTVHLTGTQGTIVAQGSEIESTYLPEGSSALPRFRLVSSVAIGRDALAFLELAVPASVPVGAVYTVRHNSLTATATAITGDTSASIASRLAGFLVSSGAVATNFGDRVRLSGPVPFSSGWSDTMSLVTMASPGVAEATENGPTPAPVGSLTRIVVPQAGWASVTNPEAAVLGEIQEDDAQLRRRYSTGVYRLGAGVLPSIQANVLNDVPGVTYARAFENPTDLTDADGRPPHSVELVVEGGDPGQVAQMLFRVKGAGIASFGNDFVTVRDVDGFGHVVRFSRPVPVYVWLRIRPFTSAEETVTGNLASAIQDAVVGFGSLLTVGQDVHLQRLAAAVLAATTGLARLEITVATGPQGGSGPAATSFGTADLAIGPRERASFTQGRISIL